MGLIREERHIMSEGIDYILDQVIPDIMGASCNRNGDKSLTSLVYNNILFDNYSVNQISPQKPWISNMKNWLREVERVQKMKGISDENKHQYISAVAAKGGFPMQVTGNVFGIGKEFVDVTKKVIDKKERERYGGISGVLSDSAKDLRNNSIGMEYTRTLMQAGVEPLLAPLLYRKLP